MQIIHPHYLLHLICVNLLVAHWLNLFLQEEKQLSTNEVEAGDKVKAPKQTQVSRWAVSGLHSFCPSDIVLSLHDISHDPHTVG